MYILYLKFLITVAEFRLALSFFNGQQFSFLDEVVNWFFIVCSLSKAFFFPFMFVKTSYPLFLVLFFWRGNSRKDYKVHVILQGFRIKNRFSSAVKNPNEARTCK